MKTIKIRDEKECPKKILSVFIGIAFILLTACSGYNVDDDALIFKTNRDIDTQCEISAFELHQILTAHFGHVRIKLSDAKYTLPDKQRVIQLSAPSRYKLYGAAKALRANWDCDDYAIAAMAPLRNYAFGVMYITTTTGSRHVINVFVNRNKKVVYWEPQTCTYYTGRFYKPELIIF